MKEIKTKEVIEQVRKQGYAILPDMYKRETLTRAMDLLTEWNERSRNTLAANVPYLNRDQPVVYNLQNKDFFFVEMLFGAERVHEVLKHFLNDPWFKQIPQEDPNYILRGYIGKSAAKALPLHIDSFIPYQGPYVIAMQSVIVLEDMDAENGCTLVVPGSHQSGRYVDQAALRDAVPVEAKAGDVVFWDSRLWHGTGENKSERSRWTLISTWTRWWLKHAFDQTRGMPQEVYSRLTNQQKAVFGFCSMPYLDETHGIDMKRGYDSLLENVVGYR